MEEPQVIESLKLSVDNTSSLSPCSATTHHVAPSREELLEKLKYVGPILQSRIDYNNQVLPLLVEIKRLEKGRADKKGKIEKTLKNPSSTKERLLLTVARKELTSLQMQIDENLAKLHEITDYDFDASQLDCFIYFKETDQKTNLTAQQLYEHIQSPSHDENSLDAINNLYAYLSTATHLNKAKTMTEEEYLLMQRNGGSARPTD